jgi:hypothetical protein
MSMQIGFKAISGYFKLDISGTLKFDLPEVGKMEHSSLITGTVVFSMN